MVAKERKNEMIKKLKETVVGEGKDKIRDVEENGEERRSE